MKNHIKKILAVMAVIVFLQGLGEIVPLVAWAKDLKEHKKTGLLKEINNLCWDTWCAGNFILNFNSLDCDFDKSVCVLDIEYALEHDIKESFEVKCSIFAQSAKSILANHYSFTMSDYFYNQISRCVDFYEASAWDYYKSHFLRYNSLKH